ncbi:DUF29 domain-containing protein [Acidithiobacillus sulfuriphilus]|uniref:DUF29 domain-containing protein n=2 Tax=Acidithiobacillus sulfuriphilus TaxID=1867749 RepID=A0A3M8R8M2_9PROT|nr:DUF29 domain-containing protein [Acidithiobacillus sulfuriphilus]RNF64917.1 DUF29 domain-containing protein [Acidithiobacillus sulfuriphilus]
MGTALKLDTSAGLYHQDFYVWTMEQADLLRRHKPDWMDWENAAEELESMGKKDRRELVSRMTVLLMHLAKWYWQAEKRSPGWSGTIEEQREQIEFSLNDSPSLRSFLQYSFPEAWGRAIKKAARETGLPLSTFPEACPWPIEDVLGDWMPE